MAYINKYLFLKLQGCLCQEIATKDKTIRCRGHNLKFHIKPILI